VKVQNLKDETLTIKTTFYEIESIVSIGIGESKSLTFQTENSSVSSLIYLKLESNKTTYELPVLVFEWGGDQKSLEKRFEFISSSINTTFPTNSLEKRIVYLNNTGELDLENISFVISESLRGIISLSIENITLLEKNSLVRIEISFLPQDKEENFEGHISAREGNVYAYLPVVFNFIKDYVPSETEVIDPLGNYTSIITEESTNEASSLGKTIGWIIVVVVILIVAWFFFKKYSGARGKAVDFSKLKINLLS